MHSYVVACVEEPLSDPECLVLARASSLLPPENIVLLITNPLNLNYFKSNISYHIKRCSNFLNRYFMVYVIPSNSLVNIYINTSINC